MQRTRKITAYDLIESVLFSKFETDKLSLSDHCVYLLVHKGILVKKQSVDNRFNTKAVGFIKKLLEQALSEELSKATNYPLLGLFPKVRIKDAVNFQLPEHLATDYPGSGGSASKAMLKIQFEYDFLSRQILELDITPFTKNDSSQAKETIDNIGVKELVVRDLGYVSIENMKMISDGRKAYFLNRLNNSANAFYEKAGERIDFHKLESRMRKQGTGTIELNAFIGEEKRFPVRMVISLVSEKVREKRIRERRAYAKKKKQTINKETLARCGVNIFITNAGKDILPAEAVVAIYGIRWQIENIFKVWKSVGGIHKVKKISKARFEFYLYAKLLLLVKTWHSMQLMEHLTQSTISYYKYLKAISGLGWGKIDFMARKIVEAIGVDGFIVKEFRKDRVHEKSLKSILNNCMSII